MADKPGDHPKATWRSKTFGKDAPDDAPSKIAWQTFRDDFIDVEKKDITRKLAFTAMPAMLLLPFAGFMAASIDQERVNTIHDPLVEETQLQESFTAENNQYHGFHFDGTWYLLTHVDDQYRLFSYSSNSGTFHFIKDQNTAFSIVRNAGETMRAFAEATTDPNVDLPDSHATLATKDWTLSKLYKQGPYSPKRHLISTTAGDSPTPQNYEEASTDLIAASIKIVNGAYGFSEGQEFLERGSETEIIQYEDEAAKTLAQIFGGSAALLLGLSLGTSGIRAGNAARVAGRRRRKKTLTPPQPQK